MLCIFRRWNCRKTSGFIKKYKSRNYEEVIEELKRLGFSDIETKIEYDLTTGWLVSNGDVESVTIDGSSKYGEGDVISSDAKIIVTYHTFKKDKS